MRTFPLPALLYSLSAAAAVAAAWQILDAALADGARRPRGELAASTDALVRAGAKRQPSERDWLWDAWWRRLETVNLTGRIDAAMPSGPTPPVDVATGAKPLRDLLAVLAITYRGAAGNRSHCVIRYAPSDDLRPPPAGAHAHVEVAALGGIKPSPTAAVPVALRVQHVNIEDTLWSPLEHVRLVEVAPDASSVTFVREDPGVPSALWRREHLRKIELSLEGIPVVQERSTPGQERAASRPTSQADSAESLPESRGTDADATREVRPGTWRVGKQDYEELSRRGKSGLEESVVASNYSSPSKRLRGVMLDRVSSGLAHFGFEPGDVLVSINAVPVGSKAEVVAEIQRQHALGTRTFVLAVVSRGNRIERRYEVP